MSMADEDDNIRITEGEGVIHGPKGQLMSEYVLTFYEFGTEINPTQNDPKLPNLSLEWLAQRMRDAGDAIDAVRAQRERERG